MIDNDMQLIQIDLFALEYKLLSTITKDISQTKLRKYDQIISLAHFDEHQKLLLLFLVNKQHSLVYDIEKQKVTWNLPNISNSLPLCCHTD